MVRFSSACWAVAVLVCEQVVSYGAVPPLEDLLPNTTKGYLSVANVDQLTEAFDKTQLGQLANDPTMKPFVEDLMRQLREKWMKSHQKLGIAWEDLDGVPSGEVAVAFMLPNESQHALAILADVTGHEQQTAAVLAKTDKNIGGGRARNPDQERKPADGLQSWLGGDGPRRSPSSGSPSKTGGRDCLR